MRIESLHINGFGHYSNHPIGPLSSPITVLYGANEAGKSTLQEFVRTILFGFPSRNGKQHFTPLQGGGHGGRIVVSASDGTRYIVSRRQGAGNGPVTITTDSGQSLPEEELARILGHHSSIVFKNIFAFTIDELRDEKSLEESNLNGHIYSAGMGVTSLPTVLKQLEADSNDIFRTRGSKQKIYRVAEDLRKINAQLREVAGNATHYGNLTEELEEIVAGLDSLQALRQETNYKLNWQKNLQSGWDDWNGLVAAQGRLAKIPLVEDFPTDGIKRLDTLQERASTARNERDTVAQQVDAAKKSLANSIENRSLLDKGDSVRTIQLDRNAYAKSVTDLPDREEELDSSRKALAAKLRDLGPDWDEERIETFDSSISVREQILGFGEKLRSASQSVTSAKTNQRQDDNSLREAQSELSRAEKAVGESEHPTVDIHQIRERRTLIRTARAKFADLARVRQHTDDVSMQLDGLSDDMRADDRSGNGAGTTISAVLAILGILLLIGGAIAGELGLVFGLVAGLSMLGTAAYLFKTRSQPVDSATKSSVVGNLRDSLQQSQLEVQELQDRLTEDAGLLKLDTIDEESLIAAESALDQQAELLNEWQNLSGQLVSATELVEERTKGLEDSTREVTTAEKGLEHARREWTEWLRQRRIRETFTPETVSEIRVEVEAGQAHLDRVRNSRERSEAIKRNIQSYTDTVVPLAMEFGIDVDPVDQNSVSRAADRLMALYDEVKDAVRREEAAMKDYEASVDNLKARDEQFNAAESEVIKLLEVGNATDPEDFRTKAEWHRQRITLEEEVHTACGRLQRLSGPGDALNSLISNLKNTNITAINEEVVRLGEQHGDIDARVQELSTESGRIKNELENLTGEEHSSVLRMKRNVLLEQMRDHARDWAKLTIARNLLTEARRKFEKERQPDVIQHAQTFFGQITDGRYQQVYAPLGEQKITVTDSNAIVKTPSQLSRGTREQVFLSLRFGLIRELGERTEPLPVLVDEVMVNFDPKRALKAACGFVELSQTNQIIVFTCHPTTVDFFEEACRIVGTPAPDVIPL